MKFNFLLLALITSLLSSTSLLAQSFTTSLKPTAVSLINNGTNTLGHEFLSAKNKDGSLSAGLMKFDLSALSGTIQSASLSIYQFTEFDNTSAEFGVYSLTTD